MNDPKAAWGVGVKKYEHQFSVKMQPTKLLAVFLKNLVKVTGLNYIDVIMVQVLKDFISRIIFQYSMHLIWGPPGDSQIFRSF